VVVVLKHKDVECGWFNKNLLGGLGKRKGLHDVAGCPLVQL
jgi:hypothetical protein